MDKVNNQFNRIIPRIGVIGTTMEEMDAVIEVEDIRKDTKYYDDFLNSIIDSLKDFSNVLNGGIVGTEGQAENISDFMIKKQVDLIIVIPVNYTLDSVILKLLREQTSPILLWNTSPLTSIPMDMDYDTAIANAIIACFPTLTNVLIKNNIKFKAVSGKVDDKNIIKIIKEYTQASKVVSVLKKSKIGFIGNSYPGITSISVDESRIIGKFGPTLIRIENATIEDFYKKVNGKKNKYDIERFKKKFAIKGLSDEEFNRSVKLYNALLDISNEYSLDAIAQLCQNVIISKEIGITPCFAYSILNSMNVMVTCEGDIGTAIAMVILREIYGDAFFAEYYLEDFKKEFILISHCGLGNINFADKKSKLRVVPQVCFPGKFGRGAAFEFNVRAGEMTMVSLSMLAHEKWTMIASNVESINGDCYPMACPQIKIRFKNGKLDEKFIEFCENGGGHHLAFAFGNQISKLEKVCDILGIEFHKI